MIVPNIIQNNIQLSVYVFISNKKYIIPKHIIDIYENNNGILVLNIIYINVSNNNPT